MHEDNLSFIDSLLLTEGKCSSPAIKEEVWELFEEYGCEYLVRLEDYMEMGKDRIDVSLLIELRDFIVEKQEEEREEEENVDC